MRAGDDQAHRRRGRERGDARTPGEHVVARVDRAARHATEANHTATHLLHAALRERLGDARAPGRLLRRARTSCASTSATPQRLSDEELRDVEDARQRVDPAQRPACAPITTTLDEAKALGAMALFGEKYGDVVRMVEIGDGSYSRELCGGTHVRSTAEIGLFKITSETSSAANVRRIEAVTGPEAVALLRRHDELLRETASALRTPPEQRADGGRGAAAREAQGGAKAGAARGASTPAALAARRAQVDGASVLTEVGRRRRRQGAARRSPTA